MPWTGVSIGKKEPTAADKDPVSNVLYSKFRRRAKLPADLVAQEAPPKGQANPYHTSATDPDEVAGLRHAARVIGTTYGIATVIGVALWIWFAIVFIGGVIIPGLSSHPQEAQHTAQPAPKPKGKLTVNTYGNEVTAFFPGEPPQQAFADALQAVHSRLIAIGETGFYGYPEYDVTCPSHGSYVAADGTPLGTQAEVAKEMFPIDPADLGQPGINCGQYLCHFATGEIIGRAPKAKP